MELSSPIIQEIRTYFFHNTEQLSQHAEIIFNFKNSEGLENTGKWEFNKCNFNTQYSCYSFEDWEFLSIIQSKIVELEKILNE